MNSASRCLLVSLCASLALAKFEVVYGGLVTTALETCATNASKPFANHITEEGNCRAVFECIMESTSASHQAILSSGSSILGFIPTVLLILGSTHTDTVRIHTRYPFLALCLSVTTINTYSDKFGWIRPGSSPINSPTSLWPSVIKSKAGDFSAKRSRIGVTLAHAIAALGAGAIVWQTVDVGRKAVLAWACWTEFYPLIWLGVGILQHVLAFLFLRISFANSAREVFKNPAEVQDKEVPVVLHHRFAHWSKVLVGMMGNANYLFGTIVFSSLTLVSGQNAIKILVVYGLIAAVAKVIAAWALQELDDWEDGFRS